MDFLSGLLSLLAAPVVAGCVYLLLLTLASRRVRAPRPAESRPRFAVIVPAHDEEEGIAGTVRNLLALEWPHDRFQVIVVADNCSDATAFRAGVAGARVLVRNDPERRGKGYALAHAFDTVLAEGRADAVVVVDADTIASPNLLSEFAAHLERGDRAVQADYGVANPDASWRTRLMAVALGSFHVLRSLARERLGLSCGLRGNGMCFATSLLREVPHEAFSIVEDVEYGLRLGERGVRIAYAAAAHVYGEMVSTGDAAKSQRRRWEEGRKRLARERGMPLLLRGLQERNPLLLDLALDLVVPPLSTLALFAFAGLLASAALGATSALVAFGICALSIVAYVARGWALSGSGLRGLADLCAAPAYIVWKVVLALKPREHRRDAWIRTARERSTP